MKAKQKQQKKRLKKIKKVKPEKDGNLTSILAYTTKNNKRKIIF